MDRATSADATSADAAPGRLVLVQELANSFDVVRGRDDLHDAVIAGRWLVDRDLLPPSRPVAASELELLRRLREAVRGLCLANSGCALHAAHIAVLNHVVEQAGLHPRLGEHAQAGLAVDRAGALGSCGHLVGIIFEALWTGQWSRLKACPGDACNYAFYDHTRNNSRTWCAMSRCGARAKMRAFRARRRAG